MLDSPLFWGSVIVAAHGIAFLVYGEQWRPGLARWNRALAAVTAAGVVVAFGATIIPKGVIW